jgi:hypothetical protein
MPRWRNADALVLGTSIFGYVSSSLTWGTMGCYTVGIAGTTVDRLFE